MKRILLIAAVMLLAGCSDDFRPDTNDQCLRTELFKMCMAALPAGPVATHYNDWDDVVDSCEKAAYYQSKRQYSQIKPECRP